MHLPDGTALLDSVVDRARMVGYPLIVAVPEIEFDHFGEARRSVDDYWLFGGSGDDVLRRFCEANRLCGYNADHIVRVTADCPLLDVEAAKLTVRHHLDTGADFTHHIAEGRGVEVFKRSALEYADRHAKGDWYREHPDEWILDWGESHGLHIELMKFSVDTQEDLDKVRRWLNAN